MDTPDHGPPHRTGAGFHPWLAVLAACAAPLWLGGLLSDIAYARTYEIQWINFAAWLIAGAMVFTGLALAWSVVQAAIDRGRNRQGLLLAGILLIAFVLGLVDNLVHAKDAWATMPEGLVWSLIVTLLSLAALFVSVSGLPGRLLHRGGAA